MAVVGRVLRIGAVAGMALGLGGCLAVPEGITPVTGFDAERYTGTWYEIALRLRVRARPPERDRDLLAQS